MIDHSRALQTAAANGSPRTTAESDSTSPTMAAPKGMAAESDSTSPTMATQNSIRIAAKIRSKGLPMYLVRVEMSGTFDPRIQGYATTEQAVPVYGLLTLPRVEEVQGGAFAAGSSLVLVAGASVSQPPHTTDYLLFGGHRWEIGTIRRVQVGEAVLLYKLQVTDMGTVAEAVAQSVAQASAEAGTATGIQTDTGADA